MQPGDDLERNAIGLADIDRRLAAATNLVKQEACIGLAEGPGDTLGQGQAVAGLDLFGKARQHVQTFIAADAGR